MAINAYCGVMGSGKSYEVVQGPLLDAIASGRRVVTNVDGINEERIHEFLVNKARGDASHFGAVVHVRTDDISKPAFFPVEHESAEGATVTPGFVQPGDLLVVDEAWKLVGVGQEDLRGAHGVLPHAPALHASGYRRCL
jgi:zona occludens toxin